MRKLWTSVLAFTLLMLMSLPVTVQAQATDPASVVKNFVEAFNRGDVEQALSYFADNAVVKLTPAPPSGGSFSGKDQIRAFLQNGAKNHNHLELLGNMQVSGEKATFVNRDVSDALKQIGVDFLDDNVEVTVVNGKITSQSITTTPQSLAKLPRPGGAGGGQGGVPSSAPAAGVGGTATNVSADNTLMAWLIGLLVCGGLAAFIGVRRAKPRA